MKTLLLKDDYRKVAARLVRQHPDRSHADQSIDEDTEVIAPDGRITALLLCNAIPSPLYKLAFELWRQVDDDLSNRASAIGTRPLPRRTKKDGTPSPRWGVNVHVLDVTEARQGILGYRDRPCRKTPLTKRRPEMLEGNERLTKLVDQLYKQHLPTFYAKQWAVVEKAPRWRLWNTAFTTVYILKNLRTAYHTDRGNLTGVMTAIMPMGKFSGGELVLARWRLAIGFRPGDLLFFDPQQLHGNLPFKGQRLSAAFFCARQIADCGK